MTNKHSVAVRFSIPLTTIMVLSLCVHGQVIDTGDKVGIGVNPPLEKFHINGSIRGNGSGGALRLNTDYGYLDMGPMNTAWAHFQTDRPLFYFNKSIYVDGAVSSYGSNNLNLLTHGTNRLTILNTNGFVGVGTESPSNLLHLYGTANTYLQLQKPGSSYTQRHK